MFDYSSEVVFLVENLTNWFVMEQNFPTPFNPETSIRFALKEDTKATLKIYNSLGSEVATLNEGAALLRADGIKIRLVSVPSEGLFRSQSAEYQESVLPKGAKIFGLTAGLPVNLEGLVGANGKVFGLESFGFSAPYKVLDEKLGFTVKNVYEQVKKMIWEFNDLRIWKLKEKIC